MLCSADELGLSEKNYQDEDGILILNRFLPDVQIGKKLEEVLHIKEDTVLDIAPTANRGDQMSIVGVAMLLTLPMTRYSLPSSISRCGLRDASTPSIIMSLRLLPSANASNVPIG